MIKCFNSLSMAQFFTGQEITPNKWPKCTKTYNSRWETDPLLKTWIARHPVDAGKVVCRFCQSVIRAHKNDLLEHTRTLKHQRNFMAHASPEDYNQFVMELNELRKDAQSMTKKRISGGGQQQSQGKTLNMDVKNNVSVNVTTWTNSTGALGDGGSGNEMWSENNDSYSATGSPSDLVSVILEEQQAASPGESHNSPESILSSSNNNHNNSTPIASIVTPNSTNTSPTPPSQYQIPVDGPLRLNLKTESEPLTLGSFPFTSSDIISAMDDDCFSLNELVAIAKFALDKVAVKLDPQFSLDQMDNSLGSPSTQTSHADPNLMTVEKKMINAKRGGKRKGKRKKSPHEDKNIKNEGGAFPLASL